MSVLNFKHLMDLLSKFISNNFIFILILHSILSTMPDLLNVDM